MGDREGRGDGVGNADTGAVGVTDGRGVPAVGRLVGDEGLDVGWNVG